MIIKKKSPILILRINNFHSFNFIEEHSKVLKSVGDVWLLKTGKLIPEKALNTILDAGGILILRAPKKQGGQWYLSYFDKYKIGLPSSGMHYPTYYQLLCSFEASPCPYGTWFHIRDFKEIGEDIVSHLTLRANGHAVLDVINRTRTAYLYAESDIDTNINLNETNAETLI